MQRAAPLEIPLLIDGRDQHGDSTFEVRDPGRRSQSVARVAQAGPKEVDSAVGAAEAALSTWRRLDAHQRAEHLRAGADALESKAETLAELLVREQGMLLRDTRRDVANGASALRAAADIGPRFMEPEVHSDAQSWISVEKEPCGVVGAIIPWNAPIGLAMGKVGPALVTGNTLVIKPSPNAPVALTRALAEVAKHLPAGAINVLNGDPAGPLLVSHPGVRKVSFTGSIATGRAVMRAAAAAIKNIDMELGGNDAAIILDDADPAAVVPDIVEAAFARTGQVCYAIKRVYVPGPAYERYAETFLEAIDQFRIGYGLDERSSLGPLNNQAQFDFVQQLALQTERGGAAVHRRGQVLDEQGWEDGYYLRPMLVTDVEPTADVVRVEQFGPLLPLVAYDSEEQALHLANDTEYGLASSVWSADESRALQLARGLEAGTTFINCHKRTPLGARTMPFGGVKQSGIGRTRTEVGLAEYVEYHAISIRRKVRP